MFYKIVNISYDGLDCFKEREFSEWKKRRDSLNLKFHKEIINYLKKKKRIDNEKWNNTALEAEAIYYLLRIQLRVRDKIESFLTKINIDQKKLFIIISYLSIIVFLAKNFIKGLINLTKIYELKNRRNHEKYDVVIGFPSHAFVKVTKNNKESIYFSFADYWLKNEKNKKLQTLNKYYIKDYIEVKKDFLYTQPEFINHDVILSHKSYKSLIKRSVKLISDMKQLIKNLKVEDFDDLILKSFVNILKLQTIPVAEFIDENSTKIDKIFVLPFSRDGCLRHKLKLKNYFFIYSYSQNITEYPTKDMQGSTLITNLEYLSDLSPGIWALSGNCIGFTKPFALNELIKKTFIENENKNELIKKTFIKNENKNLDYQNHQLCLHLGFKTELKFEKLKQNKCIVAIFDTPPEKDTIRKQNYLSDDRLSNEINSIKWIKEVISVLSEDGYFAIFKPKYRIQNYSLNYQKYLLDLSRNYADRFLILDPYCSPFGIFHIAKYAISKPYTSIHHYGEKMNVYSTYYMMKKFKMHEEGVKITELICYGEKELKKFLTKGK